MKQFGFLLALTLLFSGCVEQQEEVVEPKGPKVVKVMDIQVGESQATYEYPAEVYAAQDTTMAFEVSGKIIKFNYKEGQKVSKGSVIATLDDTILRANFNSAQANFKQAEQDYKRYTALYKSNSIAKAELERVKQQLDVMRSAFQVAKKNLGETKLIAEFDGVLAKKNVNDFARITAKQPIVVLQDTSYYKVKFFAPEHDVMQVQGEFSVENISKMIDIYVTIGNGVKKTYKATFVDISTTAEAVTRTFETTLRIERQYGTTILPGMTAKVSVVPKMRDQQAFYIPTQAIFSDDTSKALVWSIDEAMKVHAKALKVGEMQGENVQVLSGLEGVNKIVLSGVRFLKENDEVAIYQKLGE